VNSWTLHVIYIPIYGPVDVTSYRHLILSIFPRIHSTDVTTVHSLFKSDNFYIGRMTVFGNGMFDIVWLVGWIVCLFVSSLVCRAFTDFSTEEKGDDVILKQKELEKLRL
jgi:hypothetical protein